MSIHINALQGAIAETVLLPGDPQRAKYIAENILDNAICYNEVRGMLGYTGMYKGKKISVQGTGMGMPSAAIYITELLNDYQVKNLVRIGTTGGVSKDLSIGDMILPIACATDSAMLKPLSDDFNLALTPSSELLLNAIKQSQLQNTPLHLGSILTSDTFYADVNYRQAIYDQGILSVDMETAILYHLAQLHKAKALSILTVSDHIITGESADSQMREQGFMQMVYFALSVLSDELKKNDNVGLTKKVEELIH